MGHFASVAINWSVISLLRRNIAKTDHSQSIQIIIKTQTNRFFNPIVRLTLENFVKKPMLWVGRQARTVTKKLEIGLINGTMILTVALCPPQHKTFGSKSILFEKKNRIF